jgi:hypothetical protein
MWRIEPGRLAQCTVDNGYTILRDKLIKHYAMKTHGEVEGSGGLALPILTSVLDGGEWLA